MAMNTAMKFIFAVFMGHEMPFMGSSRDIHGIFIKLCFIVHGNLTSLQSESAMHFSEKQVKAPRKRKEEAFFHHMATIPSFFVNCRMEFLIGQKKGTDILKSVSKEGLMT